MNSNLEDDISFKNKPGKTHTEKKNLFFGLVIN